MPPTIKATFAASIPLLFEALCKKGTVGVWHMSGGNASPKVQPSLTILMLPSVTVTFAVMVKQLLLVYKSLLTAYDKLA